MKRVLALAALTFLWIAPAQAQTCLGAQSFDMAPMRVRADALFTTDVRVFGVGVTRGMENFFGSGGLLLQSFSGGGGVNFGGFGAAGTELKNVGNGKFFLCPVVTIAYVKFEGGSNTLVNGGGFVGFEVPTSGTIKIIPTAAASITHERIGSPFGAFGETFLNLHLGAGLILNDRISIQPQVVIPVSSDTTDTTFEVNFNFAIGRS